VARAAMIGFAATALGGCGGGSGNAATLPLVSDSIAIDPTGTCTMQGIGSTLLNADAPATILEVTTGTTGATASDKPYCMVKVKVDPQVNIWVSMPTAAWNGRFRAEGNGVFAGDSQLAPAVDSIRQGFAGAKTDTGHAGFFLSGAFGMEAPGRPNTQLQTDFAHRSEHLMAVIGKQLVKAFYGQDPVRSYWYGCSTGGRQGLMMAQRYPADYDAILAGAPAIHWDRFQAYPRLCTYDPTQDSQITRADCSSADGTCLAPGEATALQKIWGGARTTTGQLLWPGVERGTDLGALAGADPFPIPIEQGRYWVYFDPNWDWTTLNLTNYEAFFNKNAEMVGPMMATDNPDISAFKQRGGKVIMYHGWNDNLIMPQGTVRYYDRVKQTVSASDEFSRLYMVPGMGHCAGGTGVNEFGQRASGAVPREPKTDIFRALMAWSEKGQAPADITGSRIVDGAVTQTRPLCPYPQVAKYKGAGSTDDAANFTCSAP
jgi:pimeloyl-ACP methyl ester carboxylesterase